ncbi:hypothetical protein [Pseudobacillus badius]|uniref:hypothetical protein n=1 Tax=Bacillus badius TaxID=1455 RepID=UPI0007B3C570|nr:hypothetical protein [Bacillus badius]KZR57922.1 hypothetical protein A3781_19285 [Bacillus badius]
MLSAGKIYKTDSKTVLVFGVAERKDGSITYKDGVGVNLNTGKVDEVWEFANEVTTFEELDGDQLENFGHFYPIYRRMSSNNNVVTISGLARSGKDTLATAIISRVPEFNQTALGNPIKAIRNILFGNTLGKDREALIMIGQGLREKDPNIWIKTWLRLAIDSFAHRSDTRLVVSDVRQPNEFSFFKSLGALTVRIDSNEEKRREFLVKSDGKGALNEKLLKDETESHAHTFKADLIIFNEYDSTFEDEVWTVIRRIKETKGS